ncbi:MAG: class I SAM-dependent methyltransferase, partial [Candidatus Moranbacteria bacterium]|nr:class I SAM-dependent methyltransferase [Candidatus Moranbacteria bacterium]
MNCNICGNKSDFLFSSLVLNKHQVKYYKCPNCEFIQTEEPFWLDEAYNNAITDLDIGLVSRNISFSNIIEKIIKSNFNYNAKFLDYADGYGLFVRLMRDKGFDFYREDKYCDNIFAQNYDLEDIGKNNKFELVTAFEVFEHLEKPLKEIEQMFKYSDNILFSTELHNNQEFKKSDDWWYFTPETGQHVSFYSKKTLDVIANKFNLKYFSNNNSLHMFGKKDFKDNSLKNDDNFNDVAMSSLIMEDFEFSKNILKNQKINQEKSEKSLLKECSLKQSQVDRLVNDLKLSKNKLFKFQTSLRSEKKVVDEKNEQLHQKDQKINQKSE